MAVRPTPVIERFMAFVHPEPNSGCWLWTGATSDDGWGSIGMGGRGAGHLKAHRAAYKLLVNDIPAGGIIRQKCGVKACVNPDHLALALDAKGRPRQPTIIRCDNCGVEHESMATVFPRCCSLKCRVAIHTNQRGPNECWEWAGLRDDDGYGEFRFDGVKRRAHRAVCELTHGTIPPDLVVMHSCDNPPCCNPAHLSVGTVKDNAADMAAKGRTNPRRGEAAPPAKLTEEQVRAIRSDPRPGPVVAAEYPVNVQAIYKIRRGERWAHVK